MPPPPAGPPPVEGSGTLRPWLLKHFARFSRAWNWVPVEPFVVAAEDPDDPQAVSPAPSASAAKPITNERRPIKYMARADFSGHSFSWAARGFTARTSIATVVAPGLSALRKRAR